VGRTVHYRAHGSADGRWPQICRSAVVTAVDDEVKWDGTTYVDLCVFNPTGLFFNKSSHDVNLAGGTWHWYWECESEAPGEE